MTDLEKIEQQLANAKSVVQQRDEVLELVRNPLFKKLILDGYCGTEMNRLLCLSVAPELDDRQRQDSLDMARGAAYLRNFLRILEKQGDIAERDIKGCEETLEEIRAEG